MNAYAYAPKDDAKHRAEWRTPYDGAELDRFRELAAHADAHGVRFGFAISPGLDIDYDADADRSILVGKLAPLREAGVTWFLLLLDDIPMQPGLAPRQAALASWLLDALAGDALTLCPTEYVGTHPSPYLSELGAALPPEVDIMWTGPTVCSPTITADDARGWTKALGGRRMIVWDNYPVNDALMTASLHMGAYQGRAPELVELAGGILCNPMTQPRASQVPLATAMDFLAAPAGYDAAASWTRALTEVGGARAGALTSLARACADSPIAAPESLELMQRVDELEDELDGPGWIGALAELATELIAVRELTEAFPATDPAADPLGAELAPWAFGARVEAEAGLAALRLVQASRPVAVVDGAGRGRVAMPDPDSAMQTAFVVLYLWKAARADEMVVFGPRFAIYTPVVQLADGAPALDTALAVRENANAIDRLCRLALHTYDDWRIRVAGVTPRVYVDGEERSVAADGTFDAAGNVVLVRAGEHCTRVDSTTGLPFSDRRFA
jgi:hyaluronoglucosaminidase